MQAADALDDECGDEWIHLAARTLVLRALSHDSICEELSESLSSLPSTLQHCVLAEATSSPDHLLRLLQNLPECQHAAVVAASITPSKALSTTLNSRSRDYFAALASLHSSPPSLLALSICDGPANWQLKLTAPWIVQALQHHSSLTSLTISTPIDKSCAQVLISAIASLTCLETLHLGWAGGGIAAAAVPSMHLATRALPNLRDLTLFLEPSPATCPCLKETFTGVHDRAAHPPHCVARMLSAASALTSLHIETSPSGCQDSFTATDPFSLPHLKQVIISSISCHGASNLLANLSAPLTSLTVKDLRPSPCNPHTISEHVAQLQSVTVEAAHVSAAWRSQLMSNVEKFLQLEKVTFDMRSASHLIEVQYALIDSLPMALEPLHRLQQLHITTELTVLLYVMPILQAQPCLHRLELSPIAPLHAEHSDPSHTAALCRSLIKRINGMSLIHLSLHLNGLMDGADAGAARHGVSMLNMMPALTGLRLRGWRKCVQSHADLETLSFDMPVLASLLIADFAVPGIECDCVRYLGRHRGLTELVLQPTSPARAGNGFASEFVRCARYGLWPSLQSLGLDATGGAATLPEAALRTLPFWFPKLRTLMLGTARRAPVEARDAEHCIGGPPDGCGDGNDGGKPRHFVWSPTGCGESEARGDGTGRLYHRNGEDHAAWQGLKEEAGAEAREGLEVLLDWDLSRFDWDLDRFHCSEGV